MNILCKNRGRHTLELFRKALGLQEAFVFLVFPGAFANTSSIADE